MLEETFKQYKEIDLKIIESLKEDKENFELFNERGEVIKIIVSSNINKSEAAKIYEDMGLKDIDKEIEDILKEKMDSVKTKIKKLAIGKVASKGYAASNRAENSFGTKI